MWLFAAALAVAPSCTCTPAHPAERILAADAVFIGRTLRSLAGNVEYTVVKTFKGNPSTRMKIFDLADACGGARPVPGSEYLVLTRRSAGLWVTGPCEGALALDSAERYLSYLRSLDPKRPPSNLVTGQVIFETAARTSVLVRLKHGTSIHYATADEAGLFAIENVPEGEYTVEAVARGFRAVKTPRIRVERRGVTRAYVPMETERARQR
jgi:hypothetical protein